MDCRDDTTLVVEQGHAKVVPQADADAESLVRRRADLLVLLSAEIDDPSEETLSQGAGSLDAAVRAQHG